MWQEVSIFADLNIFLMREKRVWLKLNQGIPQTDMDLIKLIKRMYATVSTRERRMGIKKPSDSYKTKFVNLSDEEDSATSSSGKKAELL